MADQPIDRAGQIAGAGVETGARAQTLTRSHWLALARETLVAEGIDRVKIQVMAKRLGVARSSFYWHFESTEALHRAMLDEWLQKNTGPIMERAMRPAPDIVRALSSVFECWFDGQLFDPKLDIAVRLWARRSEVVHAVVEQADAMRVEALTKMFLRYGTPPTEATVRARVVYFTQIGHDTLETVEAPNIRFSYSAEYIHAFTGHRPDERQIAELHAKIREVYPDFQPV
ncbi:TetR/AcrR family transcriptional regulator [Rhizobium rhizosphaerae]|uniref:TetR/AcrR family transcriptional regulator n=1 Tax=Xaviernesmea rhizosphaerae TaxID=1672749 RepID=UPI0009BF7433|nr:TetR/AcrR family transcriptional regulator [Xaviernesmea rhizosphaerae]